MFNFRGIKRLHLLCAIVPAALMVVAGIVTTTGREVDATICYRRVEGPCPPPPCNQQCDYGSLCRYLDGIVDAKVVPLYEVYSEGGLDFESIPPIYVCGTLWKCTKDSSLECDGPNPPAPCAHCAVPGDNVFMCKNYIQKETKYVSDVSITGDGTCWN